MMIKRVNFDSKVRVQQMHVWSFAYREARKSNWISNFLDRHRFEIRKQLLEDELTRVEFFSRKVKQMSISWIIYIPRKIKME